MQIEKRLNLMRLKTTILLIAVLLGVNVCAEKTQSPFVKIEPTLLPSLNIPRFGHGVAYLNGELTVFGGHTSGFVLTRTAEYLKDGKWHLLQMVYNHDGGLSLPLKSGEVLLAGGYEKNLGIGQTYEVEMYNPATHSFNGFGCLATKRTHHSGVEVDSGKVIISGNWYHRDSIELYKGEMLLTGLKDVSVSKSVPYLFRTSDNNVLIVGRIDNRGHLIDGGIVDRLNGEPLHIPLLEEWHPLLPSMSPRTDEYLISDADKGDYTYLLPVSNKSGQMAIVQVHDTIFSLLPTVCPIPMESRWGPISYFTPVIVDRQSQRGYIMGINSATRRQFILCVEYAKRPAPLTLYYTEPLNNASGSIPVLLPDGDLVIAGGADSISTNFSPSAAVWLLHFGNHDPSECVLLDSCTASRSWLWWLMGAALVGGGVVMYLLIRRRSSSRLSAEQQSEKPSTTGSAPQRLSAAQEQLMQRLVQLMEEERFYLRSGQTLTDLANALNTNSRYISDCVNTSRGCSVSQFVNEYRVRHAQQLMRENPDMKLAAIAVDSGFANDKALVRSFREFTGMTPTEWKSNAAQI